jgi:F-type H+-transporting ATPase subunit b
LKRIPRFSLQLCLAFLLLAGLPGDAPRLHAQSASTTGLSKAEKIDAPETNTELEAFRHSPAVQSLARRAHVSTEFMARTMEDLNSVILILAILWFIFRTVPKMYRKRSQTLQKQLFDARSATTEANERLAVVEERLSKLAIEIDAIREQTLRDSADDEKRIQESLEAEKQRMMASVEQEIDAVGAAARRDLKKYAASLAVERAMSEIRLSDDDDRALIGSFGQNLRNNPGTNPGTNHRGERN